MGVHLKHGKWKKNIDAHRVHECYTTYLNVASNLLISTY